MPTIAPDSSLPSQIVTACRGCHQNAFRELFSLGDLHLCNAFPVFGEETPTSPLDMLLCDPQAGGCGLVQLRHTVPSKLMYRQYWYQSGLSPAMVAHLAALVADAVRMAQLRSGDVVLDIGCNDGTTLRAYRIPGLLHIGFEPSQLYSRAKIGNEVVVNDTFSADGFHRVAKGRKARLVTSIAMFYDLDDPGQFVRDVREVLAADGMWVIEMHYLPAMLASNGFDAIVHEHLTYYSLGSLRRLLLQYGLEPFDVSFNSINGGSFRVYVRHAGGSVVAPSGAGDRIRDCLSQEEALRLTQPEAFRAFQRRFDAIRAEARTFLHSAVGNGKTIYVHGASTKGNALLQYFGLDSGTITAAADVNSDKWGRTTPGTCIPIVSLDEAQRARPDYVLVLIWHLIDEVREQWRGHPTSFIVPLPKWTLLEDGR